MSSTRSINIVGGGLAGLTLGIGLRQRGVAVTIHEAGRYPRHRVCGEFISGNGPTVLSRLGLRDILEKAGAFKATTARFIAGQNHSPIRELPSPALCLSRFSLDTLLAKEFRRLGGELKENTRWSSEEQEGVVHASGRQARPTESGWRWFGIKAHARNLILAADLEMHVSANCYVGVNRIDHGEVNVCGLFRARHGDTLPKSVPELLRGKPGSSRHERLTDAQFDETSLCSVAGLSLKPQRASTKTECRIGDAVTMIPPVTGNGMSMAFESAEIAIEPLVSYSKGKKSWNETQRTIARECDTAFARRLAWARFLQWLMFSPLLRSGLSSVLLRSDSLWKLMFSKTR